MGRVELGSQDYNAFGRLNGKPAGAMAVYLLPGSDQLKASEAVYETMKEAKTFFPSDMDYAIVYDTTPAVEASIESIEHTFVEAIVLVTIVVFVFLQNFRATLIPLITVPVSLLGTFIFFPMLGFSVNTLSMFGLVLAIGIVVDDAIVVVEAVMHHLEHGMSPKEATIQAMKEVSAPVIGIALILSAVFIPVAFIPGLTGRMYQQFALTIAISVLLSAFSALSLSPALAAMLLKKPKPARGPLGVFFKGFNKVFDASTNAYLKGAGMLVRKSFITIILVGIVGAGAGFFGSKLAAGFIPEEDQGILGVNVTLPAGASLERTSAVLAQAEEILGKTEGVESYQTIGGYGAVTATFQPNFGTIFMRLKPWEERHTPEQHAFAIMKKLQREFAAIPEAIIFPFNIPTIAGFGASAGFNFLIQDRSGSLSVERLGELSQQFAAAARQRPEIGNIFTSFDPRYPQVKVEMDREKARKLGVPINEAFQALSSSLGGAYVNDFNRFGRLFRVYVQADADYRRKPEDIGDIWVRSKTTNEMIPLSTLVTITPQGGTELTNRFNLLRSVEFNGVPGCRLRLRAGADRARRGVQGIDAAGDGLHLLVDVLPGEDRAAGRAHAGRGDRAGLPAAGGDVRELAAALGGAARVAARGARGLLRRLAHGLRQQRLRAGRQHHADRPGRQERHPHRRIREGEARGGHGREGSGARIGSPALPPDPDDGLRVHPRRRAADEGVRRRGRRPERDGHGGVLGHAGRDGAGRVHDSRATSRSWRASGEGRSPPRPVRRSPRRMPEPSHAGGH